jgi:antitoxin (DNA-binding transcriptional repressor) of toxin-antitoxin stability system
MHDSHHPHPGTPALTRELLAQVAEGDELGVEDAGQPVACITPMPSKPAATRGKRQLGFWKDKIWTAPDFDEPLPEEFWCPPDDPLTK